MQEDPKTIQELRQRLLHNFTLLEEDPRRINQAQELSNYAGKIIGTITAELKYALLKGQEPEIQFLGQTSGKPLKALMRMASVKLLSDPGQD